MLASFKNTLSMHFQNSSGWTTNKKLVVIESDDWGSIRMPSQKTYQKCLESGYRVDQNLFSRYDSLLTSEDLDLLFNLLTSFKDCKGNTPIITANCLVANPDFEKIKAHNFEQYHYELITETFARYPKHDRNFEIWKEGINERVFFPQFHGREHLNVSRFMRDLQNGDIDALFAFDNQMPGIFKKNNVAKGNQYVVAFECFDKNDLEEKKKILMDGLDLFEQLFKYRSKSYIATNYVWPFEFEPILKEKGVDYIQGSKKQLIPDLNGSFYKKSHKTGEKNKYNQYYLVRNSHLEPFSNRNTDWVAKCLREINIAFQWNKPAIISTHRVNFCGFINENNRDFSLKILESLLKQIIQKWPDVEFITSSQLGDIINTNKYKYI